MENFFVDLSHLDLLAVKGEDSERFLQGQLTCDVHAATAEQAIPGAVCNNKGRVLGSFLLVRTEDGFHLEMKPGMLDGNKANFDKYIVFYKARTEDARAAFQRLGLVGEEATSVLTELFSTLPEQAGQIVEQAGHRLILRDTAEKGLAVRYELWLGEGGADIAARISQALSAGTAVDWELQDLRRGVYHVEPRHSGEFTPQALSYDQKGFVSWTKGCYTGQEIVARMHYRGQAKKRALPVRITGAGMLDAANAGSIEAAPGSRAGEIIHLLPTGEGAYEGVALLDLDKAANAPELTLGDGRVEVIED